MGVPSDFWARLFHIIDAWKYYAYPLQMLRFRRRVSYTQIDLRSLPEAIGGAPKGLPAWKLLDIAALYSHGQAMGGWVA